MLWIFGTYVPVEHTRRTDGIDRDGLNAHVVVPHPLPGTFVQYRTMQWNSNEPLSSTDTAVTGESTTASCFCQDAF